MNKIVLTGAAGRLGSYLRQALLMLCDCRALIEIQIESDLLSIETSQIAW